jgi:hypothetical protein
MEAGLLKIDRGVLPAVARDLPRAVALQVQAAWLRPNLLRLAHTWMLHGAEACSSGRALHTVGGEWVVVQLSLHMHPAMLLAGVCTRPVATAMLALDSSRPAGLQVRGGARE